MNTQKPQLSERELVLEKYKSARTNLLIMIAFTLINIILLFTNAGSMLLFSATVPYLAVGVGLVSEFTPVLVVCTIFAAITLLIYLLCWIFSKKHYGWMIAALVLFILDTLVMALTYLGIGDTSGILDVLVHIWVLYYLIIGVKYGARMKSLPAEEPVEPAAPADYTSPENPFEQ